MSNHAPLVDARTAADLRAEIVENLHISVPEWSAADPTGAPDQASAALISIVARLGEIAIQRLNQAPTKNLLAFLDMLGAARLPPEPARVPLTFTLAPGSVTDTLVPAGTQVAALPAEGDTGPVIFETDRELTAVAASIAALVSVDAERDLLSDHTAILAAPAEQGKRVFGGDLLNEHALYLSFNDYLAESLAILRVHLVVSGQAGATPDLRALQWEIWDGKNGLPLTGTETTQSMRVSGHYAFHDRSPIPVQTVNGIRGRWLRCRLLTPIHSGTSAAQGMVRAAQLPLLASILAEAVINRSELMPDAAFSNTQPIDVSRAFLPFGDKPKIGDVFYIGQREAFGRPGSVITLAVTIANPITGNPNPHPFAALKLRWEIWNGTGWLVLGTSTPTSSGTPTDGTRAFTQSGAVTFTLPGTLASTTVNGVEGHWLRVHIIEGNYGVEAFYQPDSGAPGGFRLVNATFHPPLVSTITVSYNVTTPMAPPNAVFSFNNAQFTNLGAVLVGQPVAPFVAFPAQPPALYTGFTLPSGRKSFTNRPVSVYYGVRLPPYAEKITPLGPEFSVRDAAAGTMAEHVFVLANTSAAMTTFSVSTLGGAWASRPEPAQVTLLPGLSTEIKVLVTVPQAGALPGPNVTDRGSMQLRTSASSEFQSVTFETRVGAVAVPRRALRFEYWNGAGWANLSAADGTDRLTHPGVVEFLGPPDFAASEHLGVRAYWIRALFEPGDEPRPQLRSMLLNTTIASHAVTLRNEVLGSSDASASQSFTTTRAPVLENPQLDVREAESWGRWLQVADFYASAAQDRHYVLDHIGGRVTFGDGVRGRIPPRGVGNIRMTSYRTGGGRSGNRAAGTVVQLKTTVPYVESVSNAEPAQGGVSAETDEGLIARAPRTLRHGGRAVTLQDFEDLAAAASPEVARAKAVPLRRLQADALDSQRAPGAISVIVVPDSTEAKPMPSSGLMAQVAARLRAQSTPTAELAVVGPVYVRVDVSIEIALTAMTGANAVEQAVRNVLERFLHPLTGGRNGAGWDFGRRPQLSDLHAAVSEVAGVDHIRSLNLAEFEEPVGALPTQRFLVYSGQHQVKLTFVGTE